MEPAAANITVLARYLDATNRRDVDAMVALTEGGFEFRTPRGTLRGHDQLRAAMAEPASLAVAFEPQRWFARGEDVVCFMLGRFSWPESGEPAGEEPRFARAVVRDGRLQVLQVGFPDGDSALAAADLGEGDERACPTRPT